MNTEKMKTAPATPTTTVSTYTLNKLLRLLNSKGTSGAVLLELQNERDRRMSLYRKMYCETGDKEIVAMVSRILKRSVSWEEAMVVAYLNVDLASCGDDHAGASRRTILVEEARNQRIRDQLSWDESWDATLTDRPEDMATDAAVMETAQHNAEADIDFWFAGLEAAIIAKQTEENAS